MLRIAGFCVGSLLSIAAILLFVGTPEFDRGADDADPARMEAAIENMRRKWKQQAPRSVDDAVPAAAGQDAAAEGASAGGADVAEASPPAATTANAGIARGGEPAALPEGTPAPEWQAIWTPFRTEIAARGFVRRLESVTGLDYRVSKLGSGAYQVAFAYRDPTERNAALAQIAATTGLDLSADRP